MRMRHRGEVGEVRPTLELGRVLDDRPLEGEELSNIPSPLTKLRADSL